MISLKQITYALAVEQTLHFKQAAELCHVSQSALSTAISEMEAQIGGKLFERNNKQVLITDFGCKVLDKARRIKLEMDELMQYAALDKSPLSSPMSLGVIPTIGPYLLPKVLPQVRQQYPNFRLRIVEEQSQLLVDKVRRGELDAAILALPYPIDGLLSFTFWQEDFYWICHKEQCPKHTSEITSTEIELDQLMLLKDGHCLKEHALAACKLKQLNTESEFGSTSLHTLVQMVAGKLGTTLVPEMALPQLVNDSSEFNAIHFNEPGPHRSIAFVVRPNYVKVADIELLMQLFKQQLLDLGDQAAFGKASSLME